VADGRSFAVSLARTNLGILCNAATTKDDRYRVRQVDMLPALQAYLIGRSVLLGAAAVLDRLQLVRGARE